MTNEALCPGVEVSEFMRMVGESNFKWSWGVVVGGKRHCLAVVAAVV